MTFNQLYAKARRGQLQLQKRASFDGMIDGMSRDVSEWFNPTVEQLREIKSQGGRYSDGYGEDASIYSYVETYRVRLA
ncbi:hypothetical protein [Paeniglutamicibacter sp. NPDC091659]|uniref:hypothetical protein n=1 Tax=Paeniglutamicibacter sp. NPDC091659 TaxID=3364389 RepID=UPI00382321A7